MADLDSPPELDWDNLESVHERVGHMLHSFARLLPPASDTLDIPSRPVPREQKSLPKYSGIPRHRETWLQDMMSAFSTDPVTAKNTTLETGGDGLMTSSETHPPFKPEDIAAQQQKEQEEAAAAAREAMFGGHLDEQSYHSAIMMAGGYSQAGPYSRTFPQLQQQNFIMSQNQQQNDNPNGVSRTMMRRRGARSMSPKNNQQQQRSGSNRYNNNNNNRNNNNNNQNQRQGRAVSNRNQNNNNRRNNNNKRQQQKSSSPAPAAVSADDNKPRKVPGALVAPKNNKKKSGGVATRTKSATSPDNNKNSNKKEEVRAASSSSDKQQQQQNNNNNNSSQTRTRSTYGRALSKSKRNEPEEGDLTYVFVEFKRRRLRKIPCSEFPVETGQYVIVFGDRDFDMGLVVAKEVFEKDNASSRVMMDLMDTVEFTEAQLEQIRPEREPVIRLATPAESNHLQNEFSVFEENAKKVCQYYCAAYGVDIEIIDAELQFDGKKISFFFNSPAAIDFRYLVKDLYKVFNARIWMENVNEKQKSGQLQVPPRKEPSTSNNNRSSSRHRSQSRGRNRSQSPEKQKNGEAAVPTSSTEEKAAADTTTAATA